MPRHQKTHRGTVVGAGLVALDVVVSPSGRYRFFAGGTCGNVLAILGFLGWNAHALGRLNREPAAIRITRDLRRWNVRTDRLHIGTTTRPPIIFHRIFRTVDGARHRFSFTCPACGEWLPQYRPLPVATIQAEKSVLPAADVFFFDRVSAGAIALAEHYAEKGALVFFEPSGISDPRLFAKAVRTAHILKYADDRLSQLGAIRDRALLEIQTRADEGLRYRFSGRRWHSLRSFEPATVVDTVGCGDWTSAGIIYALGQLTPADLERESEMALEAALNLGQAMAAWNCAYEGARGGMYRMSNDDFWAAITAIIKGRDREMLPARRVRSHKRLFAALCDSCHAVANTAETAVSEPVRESLSLRLRQKLDLISTKAD